MADDKLDFTINLPEQSDWQCFLFGNRPGGMGVTYRPRKGGVPNPFVRFMMRVCFDSVWVKDKPKDSPNG